VYLQAKDVHFLQKQSSVNVKHSHATRTNHQRFSMKSDFFYW